MRFYKNRRYKKASPKFQARRKKAKKLLGSVRKKGKQTVLHLSKLPNNQIFADRLFCYCTTPLDLYISSSSTIGGAVFYNFIVKANSVFNPYDPHTKLDTSSWDVQQSAGFNANPSGSTSMASATPTGLSAIWNSNCYANATVLSSMFELQLFDPGTWQLANVGGQTVGTNNEQAFEAVICPVANPKQSGGTSGAVAIDMATNYTAQKMRPQPFAVSKIFRTIGRNTPLRINCNIADLFGQPRQALIDDVSRQWNQVPGVDPELTAYYVVTLTSLGGIPFSFNTALRMNMRHHIMLSGLVAEDQD